MKFKDNFLNSNFDNEEEIHKYFEKKFKKEHIDILIQETNKHFQIGLKSRKNSNVMDEAKGNQSFIIVEEYIPRS